MRFPGLVLCLLVVPSFGSGQEARPFLVLNSGGHTGRIWDAVFTPTGKELITVSYDKTVRVWDVESGDSLRTLRTLRPPIGPGSEGRLICTALSPDDQVIHLNELDLYVTDRVKTLSQGRQHPVTTRPTSIRSFPLSQTASP